MNSKHDCEITCKYDKFINKNAEDIKLPNAEYAHTMALNAIPKKLKKKIVETIIDAYSTGSLETSVVLTSEEWDNYGMVISVWLTSHGYKAYGFSNQLSSYEIKNGIKSYVSLTIKW